MSQEICFLFRSGANVVAETGYTVIDAWSKIVEASLTAPVAAWMLTDAIEARTSYGEFVDVKTWQERCDELAAVNLSDSQCECATCEGTGVVHVENYITTDQGSQWQRTAIEGTYREECPACGGVGHEMSESMLFNGPG